MNKCLNCGNSISNDAEVCSQQCAEDYFEYVSDGEKLKDHPNFKIKIEGDIKNENKRI